MEISDPAANEHAWYYRVVLSSFPNYSPPPLTAQQSIEAIPDKPTIRKTCIDPAIVALPRNHAMELENRLDIALLTQSFRQRQYGYTDAEEWLPGHTPPEIRQRYADEQKKAGEILEAVQETSSEDGSVDSPDSSNPPKLNIPVTPPSSSEGQPSGQVLFSKAGENTQSKSTINRVKDGGWALSKSRRKRCSAEVDLEAELTCMLRRDVLILRRSSRLRNRAIGKSVFMGSFHQSIKRSRYTTSGSGK